MKLRHILVAVACVIAAWDTTASAAVTPAAVTLTAQDPARQIGVANPATGMALVRSAGRDRITVRTPDATTTRSAYCTEPAAPITVGTRYNVSAVSGTDSPLGQAVRRNVARMLALVVRHRIGVVV